VLPRQTDATTAMEPCAITTQRLKERFVQLALPATWTVRGTVACPQI
jgi:hypothetical protein